MAVSSSIPFIHFSGATTPPPNGGGKRRLLTPFLETFFFILREDHRHHWPRKLKCSSPSYYSHVHQFNSKDRSNKVVFLNPISPVCTVPYRKINVSFRRFLLLLFPSPFRAPSSSPRWRFLRPSWTARSSSCPPPTACASPGGSSRAWSRLQGREKGRNRRSQT